MKMIRFALFVLFALSALFGFMSHGVDSLAFQMPAAMALANLVAPLFVGVKLMGLPAQFSRADDDPAVAILELTKSLKETKDDLKKQQTALGDAHKEVMKAIEDGKALDKEKQQNIDIAISKANETSLEVTEVSKKIDELRKSMTERPRLVTVGGEIMKELESDGMKAKYETFKNRESKSLKIVVKEITSADVGVGMKREPYIDSLVSMERRPLRIRDLLTVIPVQTDSVKYGKQTLRTNAARIVAEGSPKPYSNYKWEDATASIETIAHLSKLTLQAIADAPRLVAEVESEMRYGLAFNEEDEILNGDGTTGHLSGLIDNATAYAVPAGMNTANILTGTDRLRVAMLQIHLAFAQPDGQVLNPINLAELELERRDPDKGGGYLFGNPDANTGVLRLWRLPVVESASMPVGEFLVGAFRYAVHLYDRMGVIVLISTENDDDFEKNKATMRCESRVGLGVRRPYGLVHGALNGGS